MRVKTLLVAYAPAATLWLGGLWAIEYRPACTWLAGACAIGVVASAFWATYILLTTPTKGK